ncbi:myb/SANT-like DNA-binding domain-containing protein 1 [Bactrocera neohumeralis]|uniref:myb/SANT-like DNA-binding domain-containing protein 1 n=1 Tax=Bactrocera neohumeralis TaxID=98809 RepID=UPI002165130B|nr:myb/SANT-like DNA-binding domain-containing protein 1 [Bactrocera neohumeralis]XP_050332551.1 myb/SANT-like DNA-binding domain-containing protein 1 [Bactrocera neohumeralis]XP_050332552.1 myb/SANT-like DNA-binding domain-containing protein 1 [Bactrocera neohumeralis]XP_050332553.1 myb/SANT-like DNA-binding domain-containing protein 1 [Bactrocera neohumeralis]
MESAVKERRKRTFWNETTEAYFVDLWEQQRDQLLGAKKNTHIYQEMSDELAKHGMELSVLDVKYKITNLTAKYRKCSMDLATSSAPVVWPLYEQVHRIISRKSVNTTDASSEESMEHKVPVNLEAFLTPLAAPLSSPSFDSHAITSPPPDSTQLPASTNVRTSKTQNSEKIISMCESLKASADEKNQLMREMVKVEREKLEVLKDLRDDNKKLTQAIMDYLSRKQ